MTVRPEQTVARQDNDHLVKLVVARSVQTQSRPPKRALQSDRLKTIDPLRPYNGKVILIVKDALHPLHHDFP
jgi:hypothetical protein